MTKEDKELLLEVSKKLPCYTCIVRPCCFSIEVGKYPRPRFKETCASFGSWINIEYSRILQIPNYYCLLDKTIVEVAKEGVK